MHRTTLQIEADLDREIFIPAMLAYIESLPEYWETVAKGVWLQIPKESREAFIRYIEESPRRLEIYAESASMRQGLIQAFLAKAH